MKVYKVYLENNEAVTPVYVPANNKAEAVEFCKGNGDILMIKEYDRDGIAINSGLIWETLRNGGFGEMECDIIVRTLRKALPAMFE